jgi:cobalamin biosynthesis protein CobT
MHTYISKAEAKLKYEEIAKRDLAGLGATRTNIRRVLKSIDFVGWSTREETGRLDRKALTRFAAGSTAIFSRREMKEAEKAAVNVLIDSSGSMGTWVTNNATRINIAQEIAIHLSKIFNSAGVSFSVDCFKETRGSLKFDNELRNTITISSSGFIRVKKWNESLNVAAEKLGAIHQFAGGGTPDYSAIYSAIDAIRKRPEHKKLIFLIIDADSYVLSLMEHLQAMADANNVKIVAIGIDSNDVTKCFRSAINVTNAESLTNVSFNHLLKNIRR